MKNTLYLVGLGLCDEQDLPLRSVEALKKCEKIFAENYTNFVREGAFARLEKIIGKKVQILPREDVEGEKIILDACAKGNSALIVPGDPMSATTHNSLLEGAKKREIEVRILHASSIFSAAPGACGLQNYKFGKTATITYWRENFEPTSFLDIIAQNKKIGAHTLCLLDVDMDMGPMKPSQAIGILRKAQKRIAEERKDSSSLENEDIFVASTIGWEEQKIWAGKLRDYKKQNENCPAIIIFCGKMHFMEKEAWERALK